MDDPTVLARWTLVLLIGPTLVSVFEHLFWMFLPLDSPAWPVITTVSAASGWAAIAYLAPFLCWSYRILCNARRIDPMRMTVSPGWGVGSYFVPIANFWIPGKAMVQASRVSGTSVPLVVLWWCLSMGFLLAGLVLFLLMFRPQSIPADFGDPGEFAPALLDHSIVASDVILTWLETIMILGLTRRHREWARAGRAEPAGAEPTSPP